MKSLSVSRIVVVADSGQGAVLATRLRRSCFTAVSVPPFSIAAPASLRPLANDNSTFQTARYSRSGKANAALRLLFSSGRR
jgi:uroporphyrinogen-III synthase